MNRKHWLSALGAAAFVVALGLVLQQTAGGQSVPISGPILTKADAIQHALAGFDSDAKVIDARLAYHKDAYAAIGAAVDYNQPDYPYKPTSPVWVVTVAGAPNHVPMTLPAHKGMVFIINAGDGELAVMASVSDFSTDENLSRMRALPDLTNRVKVVPVELTSSPGVVSPTATAIPSAP